MAPYHHRVGRRLSLADPISSGARSRSRRQIDARQGVQTQQAKVPGSVESNRQPSAVQTGELDRNVKVFNPK